MGSEPVRTAFRSPWQTGVAERWVGSCPRDLLDQVIVLNERHLKRLMAEYVRYYHEDRTHLGLAKDTPAGRPTTIPPGDAGKIRCASLYGLSHLLHNPEGIRGPCDVAAQNLASVMANDKEAIQNTEGDRWHRKEIHCSDRVAMIPQERQPTFDGIRSSRDAPKPS